ncbi:MAG: serine hydrolase domain-containing protein [Thermoanaerobaculia bacterium]
MNRLQAEAAGKGGTLGAMAGAFLALSIAVVLPPILCAEPFSAGNAPSSSPAAAPAALTTSAASAASAAPSASPVLPAGALGDRAGVLVSIFTAPAGAALALEPLVAANWSAAALAERPAAERAQALAGVRVDLGVAELAAVRVRNENEAELVFRSPAKGLWLTANLKLDPAAPHAIAGVGIELSSEPPAATSGPRLTVSEVLAKLQARVDDLAAHDDFSGAVLVANHGKILFEKAAGFADREKKVANSPATRFNIGSISKIFTQVAIAQLAAAGKLHLDDKLIQLLPDYPDRELAGRVTVQQLLDHRSGMGDIFNDRFDDRSAATLHSLADYQKLFVGKPLEFEPGTQQRYSNAGYVVLGLVVERLTGKKFADDVAAEIYARAGMTASGWLERDALPADAAIGYTRPSWQEERRGGPGGPGGPGALGGAGAGGRNPGPLGGPPPVAGPRHPNSLELPAVGSSAGGSYSTLHDLLAFDRALAEGRLSGPDRFARQGGLGIAGGTGGANAVLESNWQTGWTVIVLQNIDPPAAEALSREIRSLLTRIESDDAAAAQR